MDNVMLHTEAQIKIPIRLPLKSNLSHSIANNTGYVHELTIFANLRGESQLIAKRM